MKIYTKTGDEGDTKLFGGQKIKKSNKRIQTYGDIDELNAVLGITLAHINTPSLKNIILALQNELFILGSDLATPIEQSIGNKTIPRIKEEMVLNLEELIDKHEEQIPPIRNFILPNGTITASFLHMARTITRRAERSIVALMEEESINKTVLKYVNRLSDLFFVLARFDNCKNGILEVQVTLSGEEHNKGNTL